MDKKIAKPQWYKQSKIWIATGGCLLLVFLYIKLFGNTKRTEAVKLQNIAVSEVRFDSFQDYISAAAKVEPIRTIYLDAEEGGRIEELFVEEGESVQKGKPILRMSNSDLHLTVMNSEAALAEQTTRMRDTRLAMEQQRTSLSNQILEMKYKIQKQKRLHEHNKQFIEQGIISKDEFAVSQETLEEMEERYRLLRNQFLRDSASREVQLRQLDESLALMHNNLGIVREKLDNLLLRAPVDGQLATLDAEIGETKQRGQRLGIINVLTDYKLRADIDEHYIDRVHVGLNANFERNGKKYRLRVAKVYPDVKKGTFGVDLRFVDSLPAQIRTGQSFHLTIELGEAQKSLVIERGGFYDITGGQWIFVMDASKHRATRRPIRIGRQNPEQYEVLGGLQQGETVIISSYTSFEKLEELEISE